MPNDAIAVPVSREAGKVTLIHFHLREDAQIVGSVDAQAKTAHLTTSANADAFLFVFFGRLEFLPWRNRATL